MTSKLAIIVFLVGIIASVAGFLSCAALDLNSKQVKQSRGVASLAWASIYNWGMIFFAGTALISVAWAMGDRSPIVFVPPVEAEKIQFASVFSLWFFVCVSGLATQRAIKILRHPKDALSMRTTVLIFALMLVGLGGCTSITAPSTYVSAHERLYKAKVPYLQRYAAEHPLDKPALDDNIAQEGALIDAAKKGNFPAQ